MFNDFGEKPTPITLSDEAKKRLLKGCPGKFVKAEKWLDFVYIHIDLNGNLIIMSVTPDML